MIYFVNFFTVAALQPEEKKIVFLNYARENNFDPNNADNWYSHIDQIKLMQVTKYKFTNKLIK